MLRCLQKPACCCNIIAFETHVTGIKHQAQMKLGKTVRLFRRETVPVGRGHRIARHTLGIVVTHSELELGFCIALARALA